VAATGELLGERTVQVGAKGFAARIARDELRRIRELSQTIKEQQKQPARRVGGADLSLARPGMAGWQGSCPPCRRRLPRDATYLRDSPRRDGAPDRR
jgi:hypothetical protein